jgi:N6-L-threonylcarbamoyladenine synthase
MACRNHTIKLLPMGSTSCDDTSVALVEPTGRVLFLKSLNQDAIHAPFGGIIPEMACRNHTIKLLPMIDEVLRASGLRPQKLGGIGVTCKPGLLGSLMVGVSVAKTLSYAWGVPLLGVNHLEGHLHAPLLSDETYSPPEGFDYPFVGLCVSGGHTSLYHVKALGKYVLLGHTRDDAAGEAFDKFGKHLGLGYPAGHLVDKLAQVGNAKAYVFPRAMMQKEELDFSFSGLKTAGSLAIDKLKTGGGLTAKTTEDLCASYQEAIVDVLVEKLKRVLLHTGLKRAAVTGGVSANSRLRTRAAEVCADLGVTLAIPPLRYCTDNAAMIGLVAARRFASGERSSLKLAPEAFMKKSELR